MNIAPPVDPETQSALLPARNLVRAKAKSPNESEPSFGVGKCGLYVARTD